MLPIVQVSNYKIAVIIVYVGKLPWYFSYFLHSCNRNPDVHFIIISDDVTYDTEIPANVFIIHKTFDEIKLLIKEKLQMDIALEYPYKICDFRPAYGLVFSDLLSGYDFWGMGDIDVVFGNIRKFITDKVLQDYDVISVRHDFLVGYFTLFRNCELVNGLYKHSRDYKRVFTSPKHFCFDESNFAYLQMDDVITFEDVQCEIDSMTHVVKRLHRDKVINAYFDVHAIEGLPGKLKWDSGRLIYKQEYEIILYHMIQFKEVCTIKPSGKIPNVFRISPTRIY
jgi:hypothetical protein